MAGDKYIDGAFKGIIPFIVLLELFDVQNSIGHKNLLLKIKKEYINNPVKFILDGGGGGNKSKSKPESKPKSKPKPKSNNKNKFQNINYSQFKKL